MMILVIGGSGSGKSAFAEKMACLVSREGIKKYYLATMRIFDEEGRQKVERHKRLRREKAFFTIEQPTEIYRALEKMGSGKKTVLLECISNLAANEMFAGETPKPAMQVGQSIVSDLERLRANTTHFVVVSNNVFEDGLFYDRTTTDYIHAMGEINQRLAVMADQVVEVVAGIPVAIKQSGEWRWE